MKTKQLIYSLSAAILFAFTTAAQQTHTVTMQGLQFNPRNLTINQGDTVTWTNVDGVAHNTVSGQNGVPSGAWQSPLFASGSWSFTFDIDPGTYPYFCSPHVFVGMTGTITVEAAANLPPTVSLTAPPSGTVSSAPANFLMQADASDPDGTVTQVEFFSNGQSLGAVTTPPFELTVSNLAEGEYTFTATATDNEGATTASEPITVFVTTVRLLSPEALPDGQFRFDISGLVEGKTVIVEASSDFALWTPISTNVAASQTVIFTDPQAGPAHLFYRARLPTD